MGRVQSEKLHRDGRGDGSQNLTLAALKRGSFPLPSGRSWGIFLKKCLFIFERENERERERENLKQASGSEPDAGLKLTNSEIMT